MKINKKLILVLIILFLVTGSRYIMKKIEESKIMSEEKPRIEKFLKYNYEGIESVTLTDIIINATGVPHVKGYVNGDKNLSFDAGLYEEHFNYALNFKKDDNPKEKFDSPEKEKTVLEIEKEEETEN